MTGEGRMGRAVALRHRRPLETTGAATFAGDGPWERDLVNASAGHLRRREVIKPARPTSAAAPGAGTAFIVTENDSAPWRPPVPVVPSEL